MRKRGGMGRVSMRRQGDGFPLIEDCSHMDSFAHYFTMFVPVLWSQSPEVSRLVITLLHIPGHMEGSDELL